MTLSYLKHWQQFVSLGKYEKSICSWITCSATQGSILGPLLFLIYMNYLFRSSRKLTPIMFADDTNLFIFNSNRENVFETMNKELRKLTTLGLKPTSFPWIIPKQDIRYFILQDKEKIYQISYLHCTLNTFQSKENLSQSFSEYT